MEISRGLVIDDPWIGAILNGTKTWEMRSTATQQRGWFALIRKGTGTVCGVARLVDCGAALTVDEMLSNRAYHQIPDGMIRSGKVAKWNRPWKLADARVLPSPVPYTHKPGAVTWVLLDEAVDRSIRDQLPDLSQTSKAPSPATKVVPVAAPRNGTEFSDHRLDRSPARVVPKPISSKEDGALVGESVLTAGNLDNNHINLRAFAHRFPADVMGGSNKAQRASMEVTVDWGGPEAVRTDIDKGKGFFRSRGWVSSFFKLNEAQVGDRVQVLKIDPYTYRVRLAR